MISSELRNAGLTPLQREVSLPAPDPPRDSTTATLVDGYKPYMVATYVRAPPMMVRGEGCYLWDAENRQFLDFTAGIAVNSLGHCDPEFSRLMAQQVSRGTTPVVDALLMTAFRNRQGIWYTSRTYITILGRENCQN